MGVTVRDRQYLIRPSFRQGYADGETFDLRVGGSTGIPRSSRSWKRIRRTEDEWLSLMFLSPAVI